MRMIAFESAQIGSPKGEPEASSHRNCNPGLSDLPLDTAVNSQRGNEALLGGYGIDRRKQPCKPVMAGHYGSARPLSMKKTGTGRNSGAGG